MITVIFQHNPLDKTDNIVVQMEAGQTIHELLREVFTPSFKEFSTPTICQVNGSYVLREYWSVTQLNEGDTVTFSALVQDAVTAFYVIVAIIAVGSAVYAYSNMPKPTETNIPGAAPTYSLQGHRNQNKLAQPIEVCYGRNFIYGSFAARSYNVYKANDQYLFSLLCLGQGEFDVHGVFIEDTPIANFEDTEYEIYGPGERVTLFPDNVLDSIEVSEIEMPGINEAGGNVELGPYVANPAQTTVNRIEVDYSFSQGLYKANDKGGLDNLTITAQFEYQKIDDAGNADGPWTPFVDVNRSMATTTPQRFTEGADVPEGRYQVRAMRTNDKDRDHTAGNTMVWQKLRVFMPDVRDYGDVTLLALKAKATNNLNASSQTAVKVDATRKLPVYDTITQSWLSPRATRSAVWALCDLFRAKYGARLTDKYLSLEHLAAVDNELSSRGDTFDWIFDKRMTIWEAAKKICRAVRGVPRLPGSRVTMVRDVPQSIPKGVFTMDNIVNGSFAWEIQFFEVNEKDALRVEYMDLDTGQIETVLCQLPNGTSNNIEEMRLEGVKNRAQAFREGMYILASKYYLREGVSFSTGLEGHIPSYGDIISVSYDIPFWGTGGFVESLQKVGTNLYNIQVNVPLDFSQTGNHFINFRKSDGSANGPYLCTQVDDYTVQIGATQAPVTVKADQEPPLFQFGLGDNWSKICRVNEINPSTKETVSVKAVVYNQIIHSFDNLPVPDYGDEGSSVAIPALPVVTGLRVNTIPNEINRIQITWTPALGAQSYVLQTSSDGVNWVTVVTTTSTIHTMEVLYEKLWVRVAGINRGQGPWAVWDGDVGSESEAPSNVKGLALVSPFVGRQMSVQWEQVINANYYEVEVYDVTASRVLRTVNTTSINFSYTSDDAKTDGSTSREFRISVVAVNAIGRSATPTQITASNPQPLKTMNVTSSLRSTNRYAAIYDLNWDASTDPDVVGYRIWQSTTAGFTPVLGKHDYEVTTNYMRLEVQMWNEWEPAPGDQGTPYVYTDDTYYRIGAYDPWTDHVHLSDELFIRSEKHDIT